MAVSILTESAVSCVETLRGAVLCRSKEIHGENMSPTKLIVVALNVLAFSGPALADNVEIYLLDMLDNIQDGYCIDIAKGKGDAANPDDGLQAHTCYGTLGEVLVDQAFDPEQFADGVLYMPEFDVCMQALSTEPGASAELASCDGSTAQRWVFEGEGTISPASAVEMCLTVSGETRTGRSDENQMIALALLDCDANQAAYQTWSNRTAD